MKTKSDSISYELIQKIKKLNDQDLLRFLPQFAKKERELTLKIIHLLREVKYRRLYAKLGYPSLFEYAVYELKYSKGAAHRRLEAMELIDSFPEMETKLSNGKMSLTQAGQVQSFFKAHEREFKKQINSKNYSIKKPLTHSDKKRILNQIDGKSKLETEKIISTIAPQLIKKEKVRIVSRTETEIKFTADPELMNILERIDQLKGKQLYGPNKYREMFKYMGKLVLDKIDPVVQEQKKAKRNLNKSKSKTKNKNKLESQPQKNTNLEISHNKRNSSSLENQNSVFKPRHSRNIPVEIKRKVYVRDQSQCTYVSSQTGRRCECKFGLEIDHIQPWALNGSSNQLNNLRLRCKTHSMPSEVWNKWGESPLTQIVHYESSRR